MPVILTTSEAIDTWLRAPSSEAKTLQWPLLDDRLVIVDKPATQIKLPAVPAQGIYAEPMAKPILALLLAVAGCSAAVDVIAELPSAGQ